MQRPAAIAPDIVTADLRPDLFGERSLRPESRTLLIAVLAMLVLAGFWFRATQLNAEGLSEDELNKLETPSAKLRMILVTWPFDFMQQQIFPQGSKDQLRQWRRILVWAIATEQEFGRNVYAEGSLTDRSGYCVA